MGTGLRKLFAATLGTALALNCCGAGAGVIGDSFDSLKKGVGKLTGDSPSAPTQSPGDPTSLNSPSNPSPEFYLRVAKFHEDARQHLLAEQAYEQAIETAPNAGLPYLAYAEYKDRQGLAKEAHAIYQKALKAAPNDASVHNDLGLFYARQGKTKEAIAAYEKAVQLQPDRELYRNNLAIVLVDAGQADKAIGHLAAVYTEPVACYKMGYLLQKKERPQEALAYFNRALSLNPAMQEAKQWRDHLQSRMGPATQPALATPTQPAVQAPHGRVATQAIAQPAPRPQTPPQQAMPPSTPLPSQPGTRHFNSSQPGAARLSPPMAAAPTSLEPPSVPARAIPGRAEQAAPAAPMPPSTATPVRLPRIDKPARLPPAN